MFSSFFFPFGPYRFTSTASSKPRRSRCSLLFSFRSMLSTGSFWCVMGSSTWPVCCSRCSGRPTGDRDSSITTGKVEYLQGGLGTYSQLIFNAISCFRAPELWKSSARTFARLKLLLLFSFCFDWNDVSNAQTVFHLLFKRISSKILCHASCFQLSIWISRWNSVSRTWYVTWSVTFHWRTERLAEGFRQLKR